MTTKKNGTKLTGEQAKAMYDGIRENLADLKASYLELYQETASANLRVMSEADQRGATSEVALATLGRKRLYAEEDLVSLVEDMGRHCAEFLARAACGDPMYASYLDGIAGSLLKNVEKLKNAETVLRDLAPVLKG